MLKALITVASGHCQGKSVCMSKLQGKAGQKPREKDMGTAYG